MTITPRSPEELMKEFGERNVNTNEGTDDGVTEDFFRSALASVICWAGEETRKQLYSDGKWHQDELSSILNKIAEKI